MLDRYRKSGFTLAEMMVILTVMSVIMAATMPVLTARQGVGESSALGGSGAGVKWQRNKDFIATAYPHSFIAIGMEPDSSDLGALNHAAVMYVKNREGNITASSQIGLLKQMTVQENQDNQTVYSNNYYSAGRIAMDRYNNVAIGSNTMYTGSIGLGNVSIGTYSMYNSSASSDYNITIGRSSLQNQTGNTKRNIAIGYNSLYKFKDTNDTISIGTGYNGNYTGKATSDIYIGNHAGYNLSNGRSNDETKNNVVIGSNAHLTNKSDNVISIGTNSGSFAVSDPDNGISIGANSGAGFSDVSIGNSATNISTNSNSSNKRKDVRIGVYSGYNANTNVSFSENDGSVYVGTYAGYNSSTKQGVVHIGYKAGYRSSVNASSYASLVAIGYNAGTETLSNISNNVDIGSYAGYQQSYSATGNINIGTNAGRSASKLSNCICIGNNACMNFNNLQNSLFLGSQPTAGSTIIKGNSNNSGTAGSRSAIAPNGGLSDIREEYDMHLSGDANKIDLKKVWDPQGTLDNAEKYSQLIISPNGTAYAGTSSIIMFSDIVYGPTQTFTMYSDKRLKENIKKSNVSLSDFRKINTYQFNYKNDKTKMVGTIAQEMQEIFPKSVVQKNGYLSVDAEWIIFPMINAIKELDLKLTSINKKLNNYVTNYKKLYERAVALDNEVKKLEAENKLLSSKVNNLYLKTKIKESVNK